MEDAHICISDLGAENAGISIFGVFDGHGGKEVALFCREHMPDQVRGYLCKYRQYPRDDDAASDIFGPALTDGFHQMDNMLRDPARQLAVLRRGVCKEGGGSASSANDSDAAAGEDEKDVDDEETAPQPQVLSLLQNKIQSDLEAARDRGTLTKDEATQLMMKMTVLRRLENQSKIADRSGVGAAANVGCTAVCILLTKDKVVCANAGDSRAVMCRRGQPVELSHDHKPNDARELRRIEAAGGRVEESPVGNRVHYRVNGNLNLSRAIGDLEYKKSPDVGHEHQMICSTPDIVAFPITPDDEFIVLACDGIWDVKTNQEVCDFVRQRLAEGQTICTIIEALLDDCIAKDPKETHGLGGDNMTCLVVQLQHGR